MTIYRQGDILLQRVNDQDFEAARDVAGSGRLDRQADRLILARGEVTGHHHSIAVADAEAVTTAEAVYLRIMAPTTLDHQEHASIALEPGTYRVIRQREYQPGELPRQVAD